jgi:hypothetical protein
MRLAIPIVTLAVTGVLAAGCGSERQSNAGATAESSTDALHLPQGSERVHLEPSEFTTRIDNPYWPMAPGNRWEYRETDAEGRRQRVVVTVTGCTKTIMGIEARVVHDVVTENGQVREDTFDWYAQDRRGNVWYLGEATKEFENGKVSSTAGSWQAGVDGAQPGIIVLARPRVGAAYRQEYYPGEAEDAARVLSLDERASVPYGSFRDALLTKDYTPLEPELVEHKFYVRRVGPVLGITVSGGSDREALLRFEKAP